MDKKFCFASIAASTLIGIISRLSYEGPMQGARVPKETLGFTGIKFIMSWMITWPLILPIATAYVHKNFDMIVYWVCQYFFFRTWLFTCDVIPYNFDPSGHICACIVAMDLYLIMAQRPKTNKLI